MILQLVPVIMRVLFHHPLYIGFQKQYSVLLYFSPVCLTPKGYLPFWLLIQYCLKDSVYDDCPITVGNAMDNGHVFN